MESTIVTELASSQIPTVLSAIEAATHHVIEQLLQRPAAWWNEPSELQGWSRRVVLAHLHYGAQANRAVTLAALDGRSEPFYPGGDAQRMRTLIALDDRPLGLVASEVIDQAERLAELWRSLDDEQWRIPVDEPRLGPVTVARFAALRLTEVEVHGTDLGAGRRWSDAFVRHLLPLRVAWLPRQHRRFDADLTVRARWYLAGDRCGWLIEADDGHVSIAPHPLEAELPPTTYRIGGTDRAALAVVLGRMEAAPDPSLVQGHGTALFRSAFPGP